jgi:hypothetical protein
MTQVVSHRAFAAETLVRSRNWALEIGGVQMNIRTDFSLSTSVSLLLVSFYLSSIFFFILIRTLSGKQAGEEWKPSNKLKFFLISGNPRQKSEEKVIGSGFWRDVIVLFQIGNWRSSARK